MKRTFIALFCIALVMGGCRQPSDIELVSDEELTNLEVFAVAQADTDLVTAGIDSTGMLPADQTRYTGSFLVNSVTWDAGTVTKTVAYSRVFFADSAVRFQNHHIGYLGQDVGAVTLNSNLMFKLPHRISIGRFVGRDSSIVRGVEYISDLTGSFEPDRQYSWVVISRLVPVLTVTTEAPENLTVISPRGGTIHSRVKDLPVRWSGGKGNLSIIVSVYLPAQKKSVPLLEFRARANNGKAVIPAKLLTQLPSGTTFVLTFVLANKKEVQISQPVPGKIFAQAASVYNCFIELR
jgi:hypothetical protein